MTYLVSAYTHADPAIREHRYITVCRAVADLMREGEVVFSPICMSHGPAVHGNMPGLWSFWREIDLHFLRLCNQVVVLTMDGWQESVGCQAEIKIAQEMGLPISYRECP